MKSFICKEGASNYYLVDEGMGGFLCPPEHAAHKFSIREDRGGHEVGGYSLECNESWLPAAVKHTMAQTLKAHPGKVTEEWICDVYRHFRHCYSRDGVNDPTHHLGFLFVKKYDPSHTPRIDLF